MLQFRLGTTAHMDGCHEKKIIIIILAHSWMDLVITGKKINILTFNFIAGLLH